METRKKMEKQGVKQEDFAKKEIFILQKTQEKKDIHIN